MLLNPLRSLSLPTSPLMCLLPLLLTLMYPKMSHVSDVFSQGAVLVPNYSGFDLTHERLYTTKVGTLTPCLVIETLPGDKFDIGSQIDVKLPPLASEFYGRVDAIVELFYVPYRQLYGGWKEFISDAYFSRVEATARINSDYRNVFAQHDVDINSGVVTSNSTDELGAVPSTVGSARSFSRSNGFTTSVYHCLPQLNITGGTLYGPGTLADYLGIKSTDGGVSSTMFVYNEFPFLAYAKIYDDFYRNSFKEKPLFINPLGDSALTASAAQSLKYMPFMRYSTQVTHAAATDVLNDGTKITDLRQRHFADDYFTTATPTPNGFVDSENNTSVFIGTGTTDSDDYTSTGFTIAMLRAANSLQQWLERNNVAGYKYSDAIFAAWGVRPPELDTSCQYLGRIKTAIYQNSVAQTQPNEIVSPSVPYANAQGYKTTNLHGNGDGSLVNQFFCRDYGILMGIFSLVPHAYYATGTHRMFSHHHSVDWADPLLENIGNQAIYDFELRDYASSTQSTRPTDIFGYTVPYAEFKFIPDSIHGLFRDGQDLNPQVLSRAFAASSSPRANATFDHITTDFMDNVSAVDAEISQYGCQVAQFNIVKCARHLQKYVIPTLGTPEFMRTMLVKKGGEKHLS